jgi:hypothetical protein
VIIHRFSKGLKGLVLGLILSAVLAPSQSKAQVTARDTNAVIPMLRFSYAYQIPGGDLDERFNDHSSITFDFTTKFGNRLLLGVGGDFQFGGGVNEVNLLDSISTSEGQIIDGTGRFADIRIFQRGFRVYGNIGYLLGGPGPNPNSGFYAMGRVGFWQHQIRIENPGDLAPQLNATYAQYYDRLTNGLFFSESLGYQYLANNGYFNAFAAFEFTQGLTSGRREWQMDLRAPYDESRLDMTLGFRIGFALALYPKSNRNAKYYYY